MLEVNWSDRDSIVTILTDHYGIDSQNIKKQVKNQLLNTMSVGDLKQQIKILSKSPIQTSKMKQSELRKVLRGLVSKRANGKITYSYTENRYFTVILRIRKKMNGSFFYLLII